MSIKDKWLEIKGNNKGMRDDLVIVGIIILVGFASFGLGRLSVEERKTNSIEMRQTIPQPAAVTSATFQTLDVDESRGGEVVASRNGSKYHFPWCSGAQRMKEENKIWFASIEEARSAGYEPAANCKGLK